MTETFLVRHSSACTNMSNPPHSFLAALFFFLLLPTASTMPALSSSPPSTTIPPLHASRLSAVAPPLPSTPASNRSSILRSSNGQFSLDWVPTPDNRYTLSIVFLPGSIGAPQVWVANRNRPVSKSASLQLRSDGNLVLRDGNHSLDSLVWAAGTSTAAAMALQDSGNLLLLDGNHSILWQSFQHPCDTILPGQVVRTGTQIVSRVAYSNVSVGNYSAVIEHGGLIMFVVSSPDGPLPYHVVGFSPIDKNNTVDSVRRASPCNGTSVTYSRGGGVITFRQEGAPGCNHSFDIPIGSNDGAANSKFLRLDPDGNIRTYVYRPHYGWGADEELFSGNMVCILPGTCGGYGICSSYGDCSCPHSSLSSNAPFVAMDPSNPSSGCLPLQSPGCNAGDHFVELIGVDYFANDFLSQSNSTLDECRRACASSCKCAAAFYRQRSRSCYHYQSVMSLQNVSDSSFLAFLKIGHPSSSPQPSTKHRFWTKQMMIGLGSCLAFAILCPIVTVAVFGISIRNKLAATSSDDRFLDTLSGLPSRLSFKELFKATNGFHYKLGSGGFGSVYEGILPDGSKVAVKRLESARQGHKQFYAEVAALGSISHVNLVRLRGFCAQESHRLLVYEYMANGSLDKWLFSTSEDKKPLDWDTRFRIATDTARGLAFLHEESRDRIVHLDVKPQNILLDKDFLAKLSDFGLSKLIDRTQNDVVTNVRGTPGYVAPEWLIGGGAVTSKSDVYSFGMVLLEIVSGRRNVDPSRETLWYFPAWAALKAEEGKVLEIVDERIAGFSSSEQEAAAIRMIKVAFWCIQEDAALRPSMSSVLRILEGHSEVEDPPSLLQFAMWTQSKNVDLRLRFKDGSEAPTVSDFEIANSVLSAPR